jgi:hypothetical protein
MLTYTLVVEKNRLEKKYRHNQKYPNGNNMGQNVLGEIDFFHRLVRCLANDNALQYGPEPPGKGH